MTSPLAGVRNHTHTHTHRKHSHKHTQSHTYTHTVTQAHTANTHTQSHTQSHTHAHTHTRTRTQLTASNPYDLSTGRRSGRLGSFGGGAGQLHRPTGLALGPLRTAGPGSGGADPGHAAGGYAAASGTTGDAGGGEVIKGVGAGQRASDATVKVSPRGGQSSGQGQSDWGGADGDSDDYQCENAETAELYVADSENHRIQILTILFRPPPARPPTPPRPTAHPPSRMHASHSHAHSAGPGPAGPGAGGGGALVTVCRGVRMAVNVGGGTLGGGGGGGGGGVRVQVLACRSIGAHGFRAGQLDRPMGVAVHPGEQCLAVTEPFQVCARPET